MRLKDLSGERFGRLTVVHRSGTTVTPNGSSRPLWLCRCDCGRATTVPGPSLRNGYSKSCGCLSRETTAKRSTIHGHARRGATTRERNIWNSMKQRCGNPTNQDYAQYGGRGIRVCQRWLKSYANFYADMGPCPKDYTLDRIDGDGNYEPRNCRWASRATQRLNQKRVHWLTVKGKRVTSSEAATILGVSRWKAKRISK